ncbi:MAG: Sec-independent protein translocase protein TatB [Alphaproteobacteria bacterium]|jgi:sec-independent protein translocase protein TatB|nr:Sec-independent protein translocase protein TatB [Alphaproteobacteria bacterium]MBU2043080.1 Sec-independent protein translocase protein TatB [Alphaproteobacteria bacterium]MBU2125257.1 Sec-independent protein translocase protein TatB [Alphaproteobacteria bacterium]MBU2207836.1 Sec-independent protein translocase protein TatB [Alphaproteobacteria bacterium]MBU2291801.1 Sec-independent protein translocase protein TatB [Alphaproteobacteria bacterium]
MGGLGPGIGGLEILVIGLLALIVVGPKDLPLLLRKVGKAVGKARAMANEFRSSFDEMARQSELDELRKEVEALRTGQGLMPLGPEAEATFRDITDDLNKPLEAPTAAPALPGPDEWPDNAPPRTTRRPRAAAGVKAKAAGVSGQAKASATKPSSPKAAKAGDSPRKPSARKKAADL